MARRLSLQQFPELQYVQTCGVCHVRLCPAAGRDHSLLALCVFSSMTRFKAGYRRKSRLVSELSLREKDTEDQSSTLKAIEVTDKIGTLADHALSIPKVRHPVVISSACGYSPN
jgi:hypothetical protein